MIHLARSMRAANRYHVAALGLLALAPLAPVRGQGDTEILSNATIVQMVTGKLSKDLIVGKINAARPGYDLSSDGIISLVSSKVDQKIVALMLQVAESARRRGVAPSSLTGLDEVLANESVVRMVSGRVPRDLILAKIQISRSAFDVSATGLVSLNTSKVPEQVIKAMMAPPPPPPAAPAPIPVREAPAAAAPAAPAAAPATTKAATKAPAKAPAKTPPPPPAKKPPTSDAALLR